MNRSVLYNTKLSPGSRILYHLILDNLNPNGICYVTNDDLANVMGVCARTIRFNLTELKNANLVTVLAVGPHREITV